MDPATVKFQQALPFSVLPVSSQLAALHTVFQSSKSPVPNSCQSCGSYLTTHLTVVRNRQHSRVITTTCNACGRAHSTPLHKGNSTAFPSRKRKVTTPLHVSPNPIADISTPANQPLATTASSIKPSKQLNTKANNKKSTLHDMLKRNRDKEQKPSDMSPGGLSAFLSTL